MKKVKISPSIFAADFLKLGEEIKKLEKLGVDYIHYDIMDNHFVPNISFGPLIVETISKNTFIKGDVHLMTDLSESVVSKFFIKGIEIITLHIEANGFSKKLINFIKENDFKVGIAIKPKTSINEIIPYLDIVDLILVMTVEPGFSGQKIIHETVTKVKELSNLISNLGKEIDIEVDGGINASNINQLINDGANIIVMGSFFFSGDNSKKIIEFIRDKYEKVS
jgi:ribulose-phosphate 3-epimerase